MRKTFLLITSVVAALLFSSGLALAATINGDGGDNDLRGTAKDDIIYGRGGDDGVAARGGNDRLYGEDGNDRLSGNRGGDRIFGQAGNDVLRGIVPNDPGGNDILSGGPGANRFFGGEGRDTLTGGGGDDTYEFWRIEGWGNDTITADAAGTDTLKFIPDAWPFITGGPVVVDLEASATRDEARSIPSLCPSCPPGTLNFPATVDIEVVWGTFDVDGDVIFGDDTGDRIFGFEGDDELHGRGGNDSLSGSEDNDAIFGDDGDDAITAGPGNDIIRGGGGTDTVESTPSFYGLGDDTIDVADGDAGDSVDCGEGTDTVDVDAAIPTGGGDPVATDTVADCETVNLVP